MKFLIDPKDCLSTHGGSGYAPGSFVEGNAIICGMCGTRIDNPRPTGSDKNGNPRFGQAVGQTICLERKVKKKWIYQRE